MLRSAIALTALASLEIAMAFTSPSVGARPALRSAAPAKVCLVTPGQIPAALESTASESLVVVAGRGDKRTRKGKQFAKSYGKSRPKSGKVKDKSRTLNGGIHGQPTGGPSMP